MPKGGADYKKAVKSALVKASESVARHTGIALGGAHGGRLATIAHKTATKNASKIKDLAANVKKSAGKIATEGAVALTGIAASKMGANPAVAALAGTTMRAAITVGVQFHNNVQKAKAAAIGKAGGGFMSIVKEAGLKTISDLKSYKFQRKLEKGFAGDAAYAGLANSVGAILGATPLGKLPTGDVVAFLDPGKTAKKALKLKQRLARAVRRSKEGNLASAVEGKIGKMIGNLKK